MHIIEQRILSKFSKDPLREISTTDIVRETHPEEYSVIASDITHNDRTTSRCARRRKGLLHRRTLYHLNNLVDENILKVSSVKGKGEKHFLLAMDEGEMHIERKRKRIIISKPFISTTLIDEYESKGIVYKYDKENWSCKLNCIMLETTTGNAAQAYEHIQSCFSEVNDCVAINGFEHAITTSTQENLVQTLHRMDADTAEQDKSLNLIIEVKAISNEQKIIAFIDTYFSIKPRNVILIFRLESKHLKEKSHLFGKLLMAAAREEIKLNLQNTKLHDAPILIGKAGPYTVSKKEWQEYENSGKKCGLAFGSASIAIDLHRFFAQLGNAQEFREMILRCAKALMQANAGQHKNSHTYYKRILETSGNNVKRFFATSKCIIRFWNYDLRTHENLLELLSSTRDDVRAFCSTQRNIYRACGMPMNFDIKFSSVFTKFSSSLSTRDYNKTTIRSFMDYHLPEITSFITQKEGIARIFEGADRCRFFRRGRLEPSELINELCFLMNTYELPLIAYDFRESKGDLRLTRFLAGEEESWR